MFRTCLLSKQTTRNACVEITAFGNFQPRFSYYKLILSIVFPISNLHPTRPAATYSLMSRIQITGLLAPSRRKKHKTTRRPSTATRFELDPDDILENVATAQFISASSDGCRVYRRAENIAVPPLPNRLPAISEDENDIWPYDGLLEDEDKKESSPNPVNKRRARRYLSSVSTFCFCVHLKQVADCHTTRTNL
jgi:hypothetical protein